MSAELNNVEGTTSIKPLPIENPEKNVLKQKLRDYKWEDKYGKPDIPDPVDPCKICRLNPESKEATTETCPSQEKKPGYDCPHLQIEKKTKPFFIAQLLMRRYQFKTFQDTEELLVWKEGIYIPEGKVTVEAELEKINGENATVKNCNEISAHIKRSTYTKRNLFDKDPSLLTVNNGVLNLETGIRNNFDPRHLSLIKIPVKFDPDAKCPVILKFLNEIMDEDNTEKIKEWIGYLLERSYFIQKCFMIYGEADRGKTTFLNLVTTFVGIDNVSNEPLQDLCHSRFSMAYLFGKIINIFDDLTNVEIRTASKFKQLTGQSRCKGERKHQDPFYFYSATKLAFTANEMPKTKDLTDAFFKRWELLPFIKQFFKNKEPYQDPHLHEKMTTTTELSGLLNLAIKYRLKIREQGKFSNSTSIDENREYWMLLSDPVHRFIEEECENEKWIDKDAFFTALSRYLILKKIGTMSSNKVTRTMKEKGYTQTRQGSSGEQKWGWYGISLKGTDTPKGIDGYA
ncbi:hypothetical protein ES702_04917 [subsurface metagenome]